MYYWEAHDPVRGLVQNRSPSFFRQCLEPGLPAFLVRQESLECESVTWQSTYHEGRDECRRTRQALDLYAGRNAGPDHQEARVADGRCARITAQTNLGSRNKVGHHLIEHLVLIVRMKRPQARLKALQTKQ